MQEDEIKAAFEKALGMLLERRSEIFSAYETIIANPTDTAQPVREMERAQECRDSQDQEEYNRAFDALGAECGVLKEKIAELKA